MYYMYFWTETFTSASQTAVIAKFPLDAKYLKI